MKYTRFIGIDPGKSGAIVSIDDLGIEANATPMLNKEEYDLGGFFKLLQRLNNREAIVLIEDVHSIFGVSAKSNFQFGRGLGIIEALTVAAGLPYVKVGPKTWQKLCFQGVAEVTKGVTKTGRGKTDTKAMAAVAAARLYPGEALNFGGRAKKPHDGLVDALLMAHYCKLMHK